jgi:hypothetical protein
MSNLGEVREQETLLSAPRQAGSIDGAARSTKGGSQLHAWREGIAKLKTGSQ